MKVLKLTKPAPTISVVLPVHNGAKYISEALDSILCQTYSDFEFIIIDDGSMDDTYEILKRYQAMDNRINIISRKNKGLIETLNEGVDLARGKWLARMDSDDIALPHRFERQLKMLESMGADICGSWVQRFGTSDKRIVRLRKTNDAIKAEMLFCSPFAHPSVMMRTSLIKHLRYDTVWESAEDYDLWERAIENGYVMTNVQEVLLLYRVHNEQISIKSAEFQKQQGQEIRRRYWNFIFNKMQIDQSNVDETLKIFNVPLLEVDMDVVDTSFTQLLQGSDGESRKAIFSNLTRRYLMLAANCPNILFRWERLHEKYGTGRVFITKINFLLFRFLGIRENSIVFYFMRKIYLWSGKSE